MDTHAPVPPITEDDIAQFLVNTPGFFERHAEVLAAVQLTSPHSHRAVSLQERQAELLREKIRHLELKAAEMIRHGQENGVIAARLQAWTVELFRVRALTDLPDTLTRSLREAFGVPQATVQVWDVAPEWAEQPFAQRANADARDFAASLAKPYCGANPGLEAAQWLERPQDAASIALLPLRTAAGATFGLLVMASDDPRRFTTDMGTDFLERMAELAAAALSRLLPERATEPQA